jgi:bacteriorhodopsin
MMLVFVGLFLCFSKRGGNQPSDYRYATWIFLAMCAVAFGLNCFVQLGLGEHMNMFFVGPGNSPIVVFAQFSQWFGWYVNTPIYIFAVCLGAYVVFCLIYGLQNKRLPFSRKEKCA